MLRALLIAYVLGGLTMVPLVVLAIVGIAIYTSTPVGDSDPTKPTKARLESPDVDASGVPVGIASSSEKPPGGAGAADATSNAGPHRHSRPMQGWVTVRRTFFETPNEGSYVNQVVRSFFDARSKDPKRARPRDTFFAVLKGSVLFLYEDEAMNECWAAIEMSSYDVSIYYPSIDSGDAAGTGECARLLDGELFSKRNAIVLRVRSTEDSGKDSTSIKLPPNITKDMELGASMDKDPEQAEEDDGPQMPGAHVQDPREAQDAAAEAALREVAREEANDPTRPWFIFVKSVTQMEDWYLSLVHTSVNPSSMPTLTPLLPVFSPSDMDVLVSTLDNQPDPIPMRWLNALLGRLFFSVYRTARIEEFIISRLRRKIAKIKRPSFLSDIIVREASVGSTAPTLSKPMLKELTKEGEASVELGLHYKGEIRIIIEATATINLGARFKSYTVKLLLAIVLKELEGNLLVRVKSPPSNRVWYAFTSMPKLELEVQPVVSDRQIKWSMILKPIESLLRDAIMESVVLPNMDDIPFFDTSAYQLRGGIFADAKRKERDTSLDGEDDTPEADIKPPKGAQSMSNVELGLNGTKMGDLVITGAGRADTTTSLPELALGEERGSTPDRNSSPNRRSTWFMSPKFGSGQDAQRARRESVSDAGSDNPFEVSSDSASVTPIPELDLASTSADSSKTLPANGHAALLTELSTPPASQTPDIAVTDAPSSPSLSATKPSSSETPSLPRLRSPSVLSHKSTKSTSWLSSSSAKATSEDEDEGRSAKTNTASTLIASWKSKAAEKQLANTARETMKKWGWGVKKNAVDTNNGESTPSPSHPKQTFAEIRAHVEERRQADGSSTPSPSLLSAFTARQSPSVTSDSRFEEEATTPRGAEYPTDVMDSSDARQRTLSSVSAHVRRGSNASSTRSGYSGRLSPNHSPSLRPTNPDTSVSGASLHISPSLPKTTTEVSHLSLTSSPSVPATTASSALTPSTHEPRPRQTSLTPDVDPSVRARTTSTRSAGGTPVFASQPAAASMMRIPGIHASHKGEVMALGSPAPPPIPPRPATEGPAVVPRLPASIQNVYRMFNKNAALGANSAGTASEPSLQTGHLESLVSELPATELAAPAADADKVAPAVTRQPPPLPPRTSSMSIPSARQTPELQSEPVTSQTEPPEDQHPIEPVVEDPASAPAQEHVLLEGAALTHQDVIGKVDSEAVHSSGIDDAVTSVNQAMVSEASSHVAESTPKLMSDTIRPEVEEPEQPQDEAPPPDTPTQESPTESFTVLATPLSMSSASSRTPPPLPPR